jgi:hypothetical protein
MAKWDQLASKASEPVQLTFGVLMLASKASRFSSSLFFCSLPFHYSLFRSHFRSQIVLFYHERLRVGGIYIAACHQSGCAQYPLYMATKVNWLTPEYLST